MNYTFNKKLVEQVKAGTHCIEFNREKDSLEMLQALLRETFPYAVGTIQGIRKYYMKSKVSDAWIGSELTNLPPIPLSNFVQPEQSERDVMAELDALHKKYEQLKELADEMYETLMPIQYEGNIAIEPTKQPEPKWTPKVGEWFKHEIFGLYYCTVSDENGVEGDNQNGGKISCTLECEFTKPTDKEVEDYMVGLAKEKGFFEGVKFKWGSVNDVRTVGEWIAYDKVNDCLHCKDYVIWNGGIWAEIVNPVRWRAEKGGLFYFVDYMLDINTMPEDFSHYTTVLYNSGNYYKTKEQAEEMAVLMQFTLNNPDKVKKLMNDGE